jgi:ABC-type branched-subunit amino acid transport system ATPase component
MGKGPYAIEIENLSKHYGDLKAVDDISININKPQPWKLSRPFAHQPPER